MRFHYSKGFHVRLVAKQSFLLNYFHFKVSVRIVLKMIERAEQDECKSDKDLEPSSRQRRQ